MEKKYGFVILHYLAEEMTIRCVDNVLRNFSNEAIEIVIVDNASSNGSGKRLLDKYAHQKNVTVLLNHENSGFACGNNVGYNFLKENRNCDYIIVMNNDVLIEQTDFLRLIDELYIEDKFAVLGPDIYCPAWRMRQNPARLKGLSKARVDGLCDSYQRWCTHPVLHYCKDWITDKIKGRTLQQIQGMESINRDVEHEDIVLHGACYIFSKLFIEKRNDAFNPETFLYMEEDILYHECKNNGLKMVYSPKIKVVHLEEVSTSANHKTAYSKKKMKFNETLKSLRVLQKVMEDSN